MSLISDSRPELTMSGFAITDELATQKWRSPVPPPSQETLDFLGTSLEGLRVIDVECAKVPAPESWPQRRRFQTFLIGVGSWDGDDLVVKQIISATEDYVMDAFVRDLDRYPKAERICYFATRDFDRVVLEGRWVNVYRAHSELPGNWPHLDFDEGDEEWINIRGIFSESFIHADRGAETIAEHKAAGLAIAETPIAKQPESLLLRNFRDVVDVALSLSNGVLR